MYSSHDVCIVGRGSIFSGTWSSKEYLDSLFEGRCFISDLRKTARTSFPWNVDLVFNEDRKAEDQCYTPYGAYIDRVKLEETVRNQGGDWNALTTLEAVTIEALREALAPVRHLKELEKAEVILGLSTVDTEATFAITDETLETIYSEISKDGFPQDEAKHLVSVYEKSFNEWTTRKPWSSYAIASTLTHKVKKAFGLKGPASLVDAACASSLAAFHIALKRLKQGETDMVVTGGADVSVSPGCLVFFSRLGAMSDKINAPFDHSANGLTQGEGAALFVLMRLQDALAKGLKVYGVLRSCEGSSDGKSSAIVEPTAEGQIMAYQRAYAEAGVSDVDYLEAHGTGTQVGDKTEIESLSQQFPKQKIPIGTVKANVGHTIAAAGAAGLLKCLGMIERKAIPPSPHFEHYPKGVKTNLFLAKKAQPLEGKKGPITIGQSSFGFGGSNFHLVVQEFLPQEPVSNETLPPASHVVVCGERSYTLTELQEFMKTSQFKLPPNVVPRIEPVQLLAVPLVEQTFLELGIFPQLLDRDRVAVLSSTMIPLEGYWSAGRRVVTSALRRLAKKELKSDLAHSKIDSIFSEIEKDSMRITEDTLSGFLNNIVAGRICNAFDFKGVSFNIDSDIAGRGSVIRTAHTLLAQNHGMVVLVHADDTIVGEGEGVQRTKLHCMVLANATYALEHDLPISDILHSVSYTEEPEVCSRALGV